MGNVFQKRKFKVQNRTEFPIFIKLSDKKLRLDITNIRPGTEGKWQNIAIDIFGRKYYKIMERHVDEVLDDGDRREDLEQRNNVVLNIKPSNAGFTRILKNSTYSSSKLRQKTYCQDVLFLTVLTQQNLFQDFTEKGWNITKAGNSRKNKVMKKGGYANAYNVALNNVKVEKLSMTKGIYITTSQEIIYYDKL